MVCRVFKKKSIQRGYEQPDHMLAGADELNQSSQFHATAGMALPVEEVDQKHGCHQHLMDMNGGVGGFIPTFDPSMHLPQLTSAETAPAFMSRSSTHAPPVGLNNQLLDDIGFPSQSQNMMKLTTSCSGGDAGTGEMLLNGGEGVRFGAGADWSILDKLLESHQNLDQLFHGNGKLGGSAPAVLAPTLQQQQLRMDMGTSSLQRMPFFHYLGCDAADLLKYSK